MHEIERLLTGHLLQDPLARRSTSSRSRMHDHQPVEYERETYFQGPELLEVVVLVFVMLIPFE